MFEPLSPEQQRVLGSLAEKAAVVPDTYPMTLNGLRLACNQRNSREPITDYDDHTVLDTLDQLKARNLVRFVYASHGARSTKYRHVLDEQLRLEPAELALVTVLLLRGPQTVNELRTRTERAHAFDDNAQVEEALRGLAGRETPVVVLLPRQVGHKEPRWAHLLGEASPEELAAATSTGQPAATRTVTGAGALLEERLARLEGRVAVLEELLLGESEPPPASGEPDDDQEYDES